MITASASIEINRRRADVFGFVTDTANTQLWQSGVIRMDGPKGMPVGSVYVMESQFLGQRQISRVEVTENDGGSLTRARSTRGPLKFETIQHFRAMKRGGTLVTISARIDAGAVFKLAEPALQSITETILEADLKTLKVVLEATPQARPSSP
jgi:hypothetical protein